MLLAHSLHSRSTVLAAAACTVLLVFCPPQTTELTTHPPQQPQELPSVSTRLSALRGSGSGEGTGQEPEAGLQGRGPSTHIDCIPLKYAQLQEEFQLDLAFLEELLHL